MPWVDPARLGPVSLRAVPVGVRRVRDARTCCSSARCWRCWPWSRAAMLWVYIGVLGFFVLYVMSACMLSDLDNDWLGSAGRPLRHPRAAAARSATGRPRSATPGCRRSRGYILGQPRAVAGHRTGACSPRPSPCSRPQRSGTGARRWLAARPRPRRRAAARVRPPAHRVARRRRRRRFDRGHRLAAVPAAAALRHRRACSAACRSW